MLIMQFQLIALLLVLPRVTLGNLISTRDDVVNFGYGSLQQKPQTDRNAPVKVDIDNIRSRKLDKSTDTAYFEDTLDIDKAATSVPMTASGDTTAAETTTSTKNTESSSPTECVCDEQVKFFTWLSSCLGAIAAIFLTTTIILSIWLRNSNKQLTMVLALTEGEADDGLNEKGKRSKKPLRFPKIQMSNKEKSQDNGITNEFEF